MKCTILGMIGILFLSTSFFAQISPTPVINNEMRDISSDRRRSMELERFKRETQKPDFRETSEAQAIRFALIKEDFENIQKLVNKIIQTYNSGKKIDFKLINELAVEISKRSVRLENNLFIQKIDKTDKTNKNKDKEKEYPKTIRELIVLLDNEIGTFILSPVFSNSKLVDSKVSEKSQLELEQIIRISELIALEAKKFF